MSPKQECDYSLAERLWVSWLLRWAHLYAQKVRYPSNVKFRVHWGLRAAALSFRCISGFASGHVFSLPNQQHLSPFPAMLLPSLLQRSCSARGASVTTSVRCPSLFSCSFPTLLMLSEFRPLNGSSLCSSGDSKRQDPFQWREAGANYPA